MEMSGNLKYQKQLTFSEITVQITELGEDYHIMLRGGDKPHIGCTVLAVPRPSLTGDGSIAVTSSVLNVTGHKDEQLCRYLAEEIARKKRAVVVCTGGFHYDNISSAQIQEVLAAVREICENII